LEQESLQWAKLQPRLAVIPAMDDLTLESFAKCLNHKCRLHHGSGQLEMELIECRKLPAPGGTVGRRQPFALLFLGPQTPLLPQRIYQFDFDELGTLEIFIVPVGRDNRGVRYEATFG
jgi:hypothetical protein